ncbi:MAG: hypothetical protein JKX75_06385 [Gammaproteobacteria bacterium]|nr:hypothetical protein [Gammaproteobacteria bacterium]
MGMDDRDKKDRDEWIKQQKGRAGEKKPAPEDTEPPAPPEPAQINWNKKLNRLYRWGSIRTWLSRLVAALFVASLFYGMWVVVIPALSKIADRIEHEQTNQHRK